MNVLFASLILPAICVAISSATNCDDEVIKKIKSMRPSTNDEQFIQSLPGEYDAVYFQAGWLTSILQSNCIKVYFERRNDELLARISGWALERNYRVRYNDGVYEFLDMEDDYVYWKTYVVADFGTGYASYSCTDRNLISGSAFSTVNVRAGYGDASSALVDVANEALLEVGLPQHTRLPICPETTKTVHKKMISFVDADRGNLDSLLNML